jgi:hypothetical protein
MDGVMKNSMSLEFRFGRRQNRGELNDRSLMPRYSNKSNELPDIRVLIIDKEGRYLAHGPDDWFFTNDRSAALVLSYEEDYVAQQIEAIRKTHGIALEAVPVPLNEIYELCDRCKELFMPFMIHFDGKQFLCEECRNRYRKKIPGLLAPPRPGL